MNFLKRISLFLATNFAVLLLIGIILTILQNVLGVKLDNGSLISLLIYSLIVGFTGSTISLLISKWIAKKSYSIQLITNQNYHSLDSKGQLVYDTVKELAEKNKIKMPEVGIYNSSDPNAFATGATKNNSLVAVSTGLLNTMEKDAIEGVIGHEMAHVLNGDMVTMTLLQGVMNTFVVFLSNIIASLIANSGDKNGSSSRLTYHLVYNVLNILLGLFASIIVYWFSRHREYRADEGSAKFVGKDKMIAGLKSLKKMINLASDDNSKLATMKISTKGKNGLLKNLFSTHPDLDDRIANLEKL